MIHPYRDVLHRIQHRLMKYTGSCNSLIYTYILTCSFLRWHDVFYHITRAYQLRECVRVCIYIYTHAIVDQSDKYLSRMYKM